MPTDNKKTIILDNRFHESFTRDLQRSRHFKAITEDFSHLDIFIPKLRKDSENR